MGVQCYRGMQTDGSALFLHALNNFFKDLYCEQKDVQCTYFGLCLCQCFELVLVV